MNLAAKEKDIAAMVTKIYESPNVIHFPYHNLAHTVSVVTHSKEIANYYQMNETDQFILAVSAWFHDIGHLYGEMAGHEERGVGIMKEFLQRDFGGDAGSGFGSDDGGDFRDMTDAISRCILATKFPSRPATLSEEIICDADTYHLGTPMFRQTDVLVEQEVKIRIGKSFPDWHRKTLQFLRQHTFFTKYCRDLLEKGKQENIAWLTEQINTTS
jgi:predicted metal-dependent HD superfamily phosphohydrolase